MKLRRAIALALTPKRISVAWDTHPPALKGIIDAEAKAGNVEALKGMMRTWWQAGDQGDKADLLAYLAHAHADAISNRKQWDAAIR